MRPIFPIFFLLTFYVLLKQLNTYLVLHFPINSDPYLNLYWYKGIFNFLMAFACFILLKKSTYFEKLGIGGIGKIGFVPFYIFLPLGYAILINSLFLDPIHADSLFYLPTFVFYVFSVGLVEELMFRGYIQNQFIQYFGKSNTGIIRSILLSAILFGTMHFLRFDKGIFGEATQYSYALFIGLAFGIALYKTQRIYPLIILHALINFASGVDELGESYFLKSNLNSPLESLIILISLSPYLFYALYHSKKF